MTTAMPELDQQIAENVDQKPATPWKVILWNDDVNDVEYVTMVLQKVLKKDKSACEALMLQAHVHGKALVFSGTQEEAHTEGNPARVRQPVATLEKE